MPLEVQAQIEFENQHANGWLSGFSFEGARIEYSGLRPPPGSEVHVTFWPSGSDSDPLRLRGRVVRATELGGFAVRFDAADARLKRGLSQLVEHICELPSL